VTLVAMPDDQARTRPAQAADAEADALIGQVLNGRFEITAPIARGGMGRVYRAIQRPLGRQVALKVLDVRGVVTSRGDFQRRFFLEAATAAKLNHPNTIVIFDYGLAGDDVYFIAMELIEGRTLAQTFKAQGPMDPLRVAHIGKQICGSLGEAHTHGVVHRDLKPSNVLLARRGSDDAFVKVLDFGLVKVLGDEEPGTELTQSGVMMGTPRYMSPEQVTGRDVTGQSDIYALGAVLYHALTGRPPFDGESKFEIFSAHVSLPPTPLREMYPLYSAPPRFEALVLRCLAKDPAQRFRTMEEVERELVLCERDIRANPLAYATGSTATTMERAITQPRRAAAPRVEPQSQPQPQPQPQPVDHPPLVAPASADPTPVARSGEHSQPSAVQAQASGAQSYDAPSSPSLITGSTSAFQLPREAPARTPASSGVAGFLGVVVALALVALGATGYYVFTRSGTTAPLARPPVTSGIPSVTLPPVGGAVLPVEPTPLVPPVRLLCDVPGARLKRGAVDLGDCGVALPVPLEQSWEIDITAPGYVARRIVVFGGQGDVPVSLTRRSGGNRGGATGGGTTGSARRGGDVRNPWD
jgi:serine/threonine-protein kinase